MEYKNSKEVLEAFVGSGEKYMEVTRYKAQKVSSACSTFIKYIEAHEEYKNVRPCIVKGHLILINEDL